MAFLVISSCTQRKRTGLGVPLHASEVEPGHYDDFAHKWLSLAQARPTTPAGGLYVGRSVSEARKAAQHLNADLRFISTGFGLVEEQQPLPHYDLTVTKGSRGLADVIQDSPFSPARWWHAINKAQGCPTPISRLLNGDSRCHIFLALPKAYLCLVRDDLARITKLDKSRLRLFTSVEGRQVLPDHLRDNVLPYDERFDGLSSPNPGTRSDFPQRVMRHFVSQIFQPNNPELTGEKTAVLELMNQLTVRTIPVRIRKSDDELLALMDLNWDRAKGKASLMLRVLRDDLLVACEQNRFAGLFRNLKQQKSESK
jgi:hypothetical protein